MEDYVEVKRLSNNLGMYEEWTKVTRFLSLGLVGVEVRELVDNTSEKLTMDHIKKELKARQDLAYKYYNKTIKNMKLQEDRNKLINLKSVQDTTIEYLLEIIENLI